MASGKKNDPSSALLGPEDEETIGELPLESLVSAMPRIRTEDIEALQIPESEVPESDEPLTAPVLTAPSHTAPSRTQSETSGAGSPSTGGPEVPAGRVGQKDYLRDDGVIARGGFGAIHKTYDLRLLRSVAMKVLEKDTPKARGRFIEEGQICAQLEHPNIVPVHEAGTNSEGKPFFTMKLVRGMTLGRVVREAHGQQDFHAALHRILEIFLKLCDALAFAHDKGVLHRDLKPDNIMVGTHGQVYLMDWGIAHVIGRGEDGHDDTEPPVRLDSPKPPDKEGSVAGTPTYMSPEQALGHVSLCDERTDVFSLGAILYFILTATPPYRGKNTREKLAQAQKAEIERPERRAPGLNLPPGLCQIAMKAMSKNQAGRYPTATSLKLDLERFLRGGWWFETRTFAPGDVVLHEGEEGDEAFIITGGTAEAYRGQGQNEVLLSTIGPGDVFGEMAIFTDNRRTASVRAKGPLSVMVVTRESVEHQFGADSWTGLIVKTLARRVRELDERARMRGPARRGPSVRAARRVTSAPASGAKATPPPSTAAVANPKTKLYSPGELGYSVDESAEQAEPTLEGDLWGAPGNDSFLSSFLGREALGDDRFLSSSNFRFGDDTLPAVLALLEREDFDRASQLYEHSDGGLASALLAEAELRPELAPSLTRLFQHTRDFKSAGRAFEIAGDLQAAAENFEKGDAFYAAAGCYKQLGDLERAARAFERGGDRGQAMHAYQESGVRTGMADLLIREGRYADAAAIYRELGDLGREVEMLRLVPVYDAGRVEAALRLGELYAQSGQVGDAAQLLVDTLQSCEAAWDDNRVAVAVAPLLITLGREEDASRVMAWAKAQTAGGPVPSLQELGQVTRELDLKESTAIREALCRADPEAYQVLKRIPLFEALALIDMRDLYRCCEERVYDADTVLIEAGHSPQGLFVVLEGTVEVRLETGELLSTIGAGETLGEVSLVTDGPATAQARSLEQGRSLFISRKSFEHFLYHHEAAALKVHRFFNHILAERMTVLSGVTAKR